MLKDILSRACTNVESYKTKLRAHSGFEGIEIVGDARWLRKIYRYFVLRCVPRALSGMRLRGGNHIFKYRKKGGTYVKSARGVKWFAVPIRGSSRVVRFNCAAATDTCASNKRLSPSDHNYANFAFHYKYSRTTVSRRIIRLLGERSKRKPLAFIKAPQPARWMGDTWGCSLQSALYVH